MKFTSTVLALAAAAGTAHAHTTVYAIWVNDVDQGLGNSASGYIRTPPNNDPVKDVTSSDMTCNVNNVATSQTVEVAGGDKITFEWHHNSRDSSDDIIASSHKGPVQVYIAPTSSDGSGDVWVKLYSDGYDSTTDTWAVDTLIADAGKHSITLPELAAGEYLLRPEIIALHEGENEGGAQFYMECVQIKVTSSGSVSLPSGIAIPGEYTATDPGILFDIYNTFTSYTPPGGDVWDGASSGNTTAATSAAASSVAATTAAAVATSSAAAVSSAPASSTVATSYVASSSAAASPVAASSTSSAAVASSTAKSCAKKRHARDVHHQGL